MEICSKFQKIEALEGAWLIHTDNAGIKIHFVTDEIVRVRASFDKAFAEESYALVTTAWEDRLDFLFEGERTRVTAVTPTVAETEETITFATRNVTLVLEKDPICFKFYDAEGDLFYTDVAGNPFVLDSNNRLTH